MFSLTKTFAKDQFQVTPIMMDGEPIFLPQEIEEQFGYTDLAKSIRNSDGFKNGTDYFVLENDKLEQLKKILQDSNTVPQISPKARSLTVITESGFWGVAFRSNKPECMALRIWVTHEVLPAIRRTGTYTAGKGKPDMWKISRTFSGAKKIAKESGMSEVQARLHAAKTVKDTHNVDVFAMLGIEPPVDLPHDLTYCTETARKLYDALAGNLQPAAGEYVRIDDIIEYLSSLGITLSRNNELWACIKAMGFRKIRKQLGIDRVMAVHDAMWEGRQS